MNQIKFVIILTLLFATSFFAQENPYPNELKGYEFFGNGKLKTLKLGVSNRDDINKIFGTTCEDSCDYDENLKIKLLYFTNLSRFVNGKKITSTANPEHIGKLFSIVLRPKAVISFHDKIFSSKYVRSLGGTYAHGKDRVNNITYDVYNDEYGLSYTLFKSVFTSDKDSLGLTQGDLVSIEYQIPFTQQKNMFTEQK